MASQRQIQRLVKLMVDADIKLFTEQVEGRLPADTVFRNDLFRRLRPPCHDSNEGGGVF